MSDKGQLINELVGRRIEALKLFRAMPSQVPFFKSLASEELIRGGNRSGKSTLAAVRFASVATGLPVLGPNGEPMVQRRPWQEDRPLLMWVIGFQQNHIGGTIHRLLFRPGLFKIIRDEKDGQWRSWRPWNKSDLAREGETKPSPPLIPTRYTLGQRDGWAWENRAERVFTLCRLKNGTEIYAYPSTGEPKAGDPVDMIWIDEAIRYYRHYAEWQARLSDNRGRLLWSSWPKTSNPALVRMTERAKEQEDRGLQADVREFLFRFSDNPFIPVDEKRKRLEGWDDEERRARDLGEYTTDLLLMYPNFNRDFHRAIKEFKAEDDNLSAVLRDNNGVPPDDWTRELILDPGTARPAVLFGAIPPPELGDHLVVYDEIYVPRLDAHQLARKVLSKAKGKWFERFIIDAHAARQKPMGFGGTIGGNYRKAFDEHHLVCRQTGSGFSPGSDDIPARVGMVQSGLTIRSDGSAKIRVCIDSCPNFVRQIENYIRAMEGDVIGDRPKKGQKADLVECLEYWCSRNPQYVPPPNSTSDKSPAHRYFLKLRAKRERQHSGSDFVNIGPGTAKNAIPPELEFGQEKKW